MIFSANYNCKNLTEKKAILQVSGRKTAVPRLSALLPFLII